MLMRAVRALAVGAVLFASACGQLIPSDRVVSNGSGVEGYVQDQAGLPLEGVNVVVVNPAGQSVTPEERTFGSGKDGYYFVPAPPGTWTVTFFRPGYEHIKLPIDIRDRRYARLDVVV